MTTVVQTHRIELASILVLCSLLILILLHFTLPVLPRQELSNTADPAVIEESVIQKTRLINSGAGHQLDYAETEHFVAAKVGDGALPVLEIRHFTKEPKSPIETVKGPWEPRRSA